MEKYSRSGHRSRIRSLYLDNEIHSLSDVNLLELFLSLTIPQKDVKPLTYELFNKFGSLEKIFSASTEELLSVTGVGENTALAIELHKAFSSASREMPKDDLLDIENRKKFAKNILSAPMEFGIYALDSSGMIIQTFYYDSINKNNADNIIKEVTVSECAYILVARNSNGIIMADDITSISDIKLGLQNLGVYILDYITVGQDKITAVSESEKQNLVKYE